MNFPYYLYPGAPCSGYYNTEQYNPELIRLEREIKKLESFDGIFHLTIGSAMEEVFALESKLQEKKYDDCVTFQWQQLYPYHLHYSANCNIPVVHFIVSPNETYSSDRFIEPAFIKRTPWMNWEKHDKTFISRTFRYIVMIFCTMMPTVDDRNNKICKKMSEVFKNENFDMFKQTDYDVSFIISFYKMFRFVVDKIKTNGGVITCFSFAVFLATTTKSTINNYIMFKEVCSVFGTPGEKSILAEWLFYNENYLVKLYDRVGSISYVAPNGNNDQQILHICPHKQHDAIIFDILPTRLMSTLFTDCYIPEFNNLREKIHRISKNVLVKKNSIIKHDEQFNVNAPNKSSEAITEFIGNASKLNPIGIENDCIKYMFEIFNHITIFRYINSLNWIEKLVEENHLIPTDVLSFYINIKKFGATNELATELVRQYKLNKKIFQIDFLMLLVFSHMNNIKLRISSEIDELIVFHHCIKTDVIIDTNELFGNNVICFE